MGKELLAGCVAFEFSLLAHDDDLYLDSHGPWLAACCTLVFSACGTWIWLFGGARLAPIM